MQGIPGVSAIALIIIIVGVILIFIGIFLSESNSANSEKVDMETRAIVFIGPFPIVKGFSKRTQIVLFIIAISLFTVWILWMM